MDHIKANPNATLNRPPVTLSPHARFLDGGALDANSGGIVTDQGNIYSITRADMAPGQPPAERRPDGSTAMPAIRLGKLSVLRSGVQHSTTYGAELETANLAPDGSYAPLPPERLDEVKELYRHMGESGTPPAGDPADLEHQFWNMIHGEVDAARGRGEVVASLSVYGQRGLGPQDANPHPYVTHIVGKMTERTGFPTTEMFRTGGAQAHTSVSNTIAGMAAAEAMEYLGPVLAAPTLAGPFVHGGVAGNLAHATFTPQQEAHLRANGVTRPDLSRPYQSWRYLLRLLGSPSAGTWTKPAADSEGEYLERAHRLLANGEISNSDRTYGHHTNRVRVILDGSGANTIEDCSADTALGNPELLVPLQLLRAGLITALEKMAMQGRDPRLFVASKLGTVALTRTQRLELAHHTMLREVARYGNDAHTYGKLPGQWLPWLLRVAEGAPFTRLSGPHALRLRQSFATYEQTAPAIDAWCKAHNTNTPTAQTWFDLGLNNPAVYMNEHYVQERQKGANREEAIRRVELAAGQALHMASVRQRGKARQAA